MRRLGTLARNDPMPVFEGDTVKRAVIAALTLAVLTASSPALADGRFDAAVARMDELPNARSLVVLHRGEIVCEAYFHGADADTLLHLRSITKSVVSLLAGIALAEGHLDGLDQTVDSFVPEAELSGVHLEHLLSMTSGLPGDESIILGLMAAPDALAWSMLHEVEGAPGERWAYSNAGVQLLSTALARATGEDLVEYARQRLFTPLGIDRLAWSRDERGTVHGAFGLKLTAVGLARLGELVLANGIWDGRTVIARDWIERSCRPRTDLDVGYYAEAGDVGYGLLWWTGCSSARDVCFGVGYGGQYLLIAPDLDLVVATNSAWYLEPEVAFPHAQTVFRVIFDDIVGVVAEGVGGE